MIIKFESGALWNEAGKWKWDTNDLEFAAFIRWSDYPDCINWPNPEQTVAWLKQYLEEYEAHNKKSEL